MGQFKPMVKMMTTEPTVELKLKKGGSVSKEKKMQMGGALAPTATPMPAGMPARGGMAGAASPMRPPLAARRRMMRGAPAGPVGRAASMMKKGGEAEESMAEHKAEAKATSDVAKKLKEHAGKPASKAHKGLKTGGVVKGQGGYATGGVVNGQGGYKHGGKVKKYAKGGIITEQEGSRDAGPYKNTKMVTTKPDHSPAKTGGVNLGNAGGYKKGGAAKKYAKGGAVNDSGKAESMPQGHKKPSAPVSITQLSGSFKKGGMVPTPAQKKAQEQFKKENATAMKEAKTKDVEVYSKYGKKMRYGGAC